MPTWSLRAVFGLGDMNLFTKLKPLSWTKDVAKDNFLKKSHIFCLMISLFKFLWSKNNPFLCPISWFIWSLMLKQRLCFTKWSRRSPQYEFLNINVEERHQGVLDLTFHYAIWGFLYSRPRSTMASYDLIFEISRRGERLFRKTKWLFQDQRPGISWNRTQKRTIFW